MMPDCQDLDLRAAPPSHGAASDAAEPAGPEPAGPETLALDPPLDDAPTAPRRRMGPRAILFAGVAGACVLGMGLGLWARPAMNERRVAVAAPEPEAPPVDPAARHLKIVVDDGPAAQVGAPIETLSPAPKPLFASLRPRQDGRAVMGQVPELTRLQPKPLPKIEAPHLDAPHISPPRLPDLAPMVTAALAAPGHWLATLKPAPHAVEAHPVETAAAAPTPAHRLQLASAERAAKAAEAQAAADAARAAAAERAQVRAQQARQEQARFERVRFDQEQARQEQARQEQARQEQARKQRAQQAKLAAAKAARQQEAKLEQARLEQARLEQAKGEQARWDQEKAARTDKLRQAKTDKAAADKAEAAKLAQAEARGRAEARAETKAMVAAEARDEAKKRERLEALVHAVQKVLPHARPQPPAETARQDHKAKGRHQDPQVERASLKPKRGPHAVEPAARSHPVQIAPADPSGLVKVSTPRCASRDPGAALVCSDPSLGAADRQLSRAYQGARAAGVPEAQLQAQQQRWLAARSAAAREAPWAMRDVYLARIAELNSQARDAHGDGY